MPRDRVTSSAWLVVMVALVAITTGAIAASAAMPPSAAKPDHGRAGGPRFELSGSVDGLWPGGQRPLVVTVRNPYPFDIVLGSLTVGVASASAACPASLLHVSTFDGEVRIAGRGTGMVELVASLDPGAPDECQGAEWELTYSATARRA